MRQSIENEGQPARKGAKIYFAASLIAQVGALVRYTLLAHLLGPEQLGLAATILMTQQFLEWISDSGSDRFLVQDKHGDEPHIQNMVQLVFLGRGAFISSALLLFAFPIAALAHAPALAGGLMILALYPLAGGFIHLDLRRAQRHNDFRPEGLAILIAEIMCFVATLVAVYIVRDFTAAIYGIIARTLGITLVSHFMAKRKYQFGLSREHAPRLARFAAPMMLNGVCLFFGGQGERILIANRLGLVQLGYYSAIAVLVINPFSVLHRFLTPIYLTKIASARDDPALRERQAASLGGVTLLLSVLIAIGFAIVAKPAVLILYGQRFSQPVLVIALIGILQATRFLRSWPSTVALGMGRSGIVAADNVIRLVGIGFAIPAIMVMPNLIGVLVGFIFGESLALVVTIILVNRAAGRFILHDWRRVLALALVSLAIVAWIEALAKPSVPPLLALMAATAALARWMWLSETATLLEVKSFLRQIYGSAMGAVARRMGRRAHAAALVTASPGASDGRRHGAGRAVADMDPIEAQKRANLAEDVVD